MGSILQPHVILLYMRGSECFINTAKSAQTIVRQSFTTHVHKIGCEKNQRCFIYFD